MARDAEGGGVTELTFGSLFAGVGGFDLGLERAGLRCLWQVEKDPECRRVLKARWPNVAQFEDVKNVGRENLKRVDVICGGFPCQPFSVAGSRGGVNDDRHLWPEMRRIIAELRPTWVIGENVTGIATMVNATRDAKVEGAAIARYPNEDHYDALYTRQEEMLLDAICQDLETLGYEVQPLIIPAVAVQADHVRSRVFIIAHAQSAGLPNGDAQPGGRANGYGPAR